ncbi:alpha-ketoglutarate-dependent dioxygenase AlkB family protein [Chitinophaga flava]|uniref:Alpha-ketoglutarate-dependent dioxygenase AlkB n=1 Tax=Chitinophaga flava TaxID=2259036 RepID=A0A365XWW4_9BACT|nr:alpha-ketoglutarate-dependent dioxygenase AlkB [Chitinophaga flava]RBL90837.1 alpha-ketoglutarate-dependent dioxygenase AlkB [Chitinophaga flava]
MQLKLFDDDRQLMLPQDLMEYYPSFLNRTESDQLLQQLLNTVPWQQSKIMMYEKEVLTPRLSAWFGSEPIRSGDQRPVLPWPEVLQTLKTKVEVHTGMSFDGVLLNYYRDNNDSVAWHSDKDTVPGLKTEIASISIGEERNFDFRRKDNHRHRYAIRLEHGSLLLMKGDLQQYWEHRIAKSTLPMKARINLTFRKVGADKIVSYT